ncbi:DUF4352 domain-containing protein [Clostridium tagluense]|uniref:DUF4352 domain-containing protein n=1 Tax=Clostridium tagluense TaxID=360422 RepID=A0A401USF1_9CLOT|nr:DUF4352 domain-containing protein [Clostridium tagluense]GCD12489.1 hypothetical protein Ctaglu_41120 [Clostridium tagluense]
MSKMVNCKACGKEIAKGVNKCVHCGKDQRNFFAKHKVITGILVVVVIGIIGSTAGGKKDDTAKVADNNKTTTTATAKVAETPVVKDVYAIGEAVKLKDAVVTVTKVEKSNGGEYDKPKDGMEFVIATVSIKNSGTSEISYNPFDFKMQNSKGQITDEGFTTINTDSALASGNLASNGEITGTMAFEQPKNDTALILKYKGSMFSNKEIKFKLN